MAQSSFFGLTSFGAGTAYEKTVAKPLLFHEVPDNVFLDLFRKHALGQSDLAAALQVRAFARPFDCLCIPSILLMQVDGANTMLTKDVLGIFQQALGRKANVAEVNAVQT